MVAFPSYFSKEQKPVVSVCTDTRPTRARDESFSSNAARLSAGATQYCNNDYNIR
jgi:hypothetical protein